MTHNLTSINNRLDAHLQIDKRIAYHQSGHAVAICLGNKKKQLPDVHFQILIMQHVRDGQPSVPFARRLGNHTAEIEGGRLIQALPLSMAEALQGLSKPQQEEYKCAFEADIINLLVGPLAEAKYVASRDGEVFNANLVNMAALRFYGGNQDLDLIAEYMDCFMLNKKDYQRKLKELYLSAYSFINNKANWHAISSLAKHILDEPASCLNCDEITNLLESYVDSKNKNDKLQQWVKSPVENPASMAKDFLSVPLYN